MPFKSKAQQRFMFAIEAAGELPQGTAHRWARHTKNIKKLPEHVKKASPNFVAGFCKIAVTDLPEEARYLAIVPMQDYVKGSNLDKETGQKRQVNSRTKGVTNEDREMNPELKHDWKNVRQP
jgi:hypothetical protein